VTLLKKEIPIKVVGNGNKCGDCLHFEKIAHSKYPKPCIHLGVGKKANAPNCYDDNVFLLQRVEPDILNQIGLLHKDMNSSQSRILANTLRRRKQFRRAGVAFGMPVFVCLGRDYLNNYYKGYVIGVQNHGEPLIFVTTDLNKKQVAKPAILSLLKESVLNVQEFARKRRELIKKKHLNDPDNSFMGTKIKKNKADEMYEPPTLETVPETWFDLYAKRKVKPGSKGLKFKL
jgi:hypothetical protein